MVKVEFHSPAEHVINGVQHSIEAHFIHKLRVTNTTPPNQPTDIALTLLFSPTPTPTSSPNKTSPLIGQFIEANSTVSPQSGKIDSGNVPQ